jgi:hypothetical protein
VAFARGRLSPADERAADQHLRVCPACAEDVDEIFRFDERSDEEWDAEGEAFMKAFWRRLAAEEVDEKATAPITQNAAAAMIAVGTIAAKPSEGVQPADGDRSVWGEYPVMGGRILASVVEEEEGEVHITCWTEEEQLAGAIVRLDFSNPDTGARYVVELELAQVQGKRLWKRTWVGHTADLTGYWLNILGPEDK